MSVAPPVRLHHVGIVVADMAKACASYVDRFGFEVVSEVIHDPTQTAYVQFLRMPGDSTYVELVAPDGPASTLSNALKKGGGLNHLCYATPDLAGSIAAMTAEGMRLIRTPTPAVAFAGRRIAWLLGRDLALVELVEQGPAGAL